MTDADMIYSAILRAERRLKATVADGHHPHAANLARAALIAAQTIREEIGNVLSGGKTGPESEPFRVSFSPGRIEGVFRISTVEDAEALIRTINAFKLLFEGDYIPDQNEGL